MKLFSEKVQHTLTNSSLNILQVEAFEEIFFGVYEVEINKSKYPVEKISEHEGNPVVSVPVTVEGVKRDYPFVLSKGKFEILFNENNKLNDEYEIVEDTIKDILLHEEAPVEVEEVINIPEVVDNSGKILKQINRAKKEAHRALQLEKTKNLKQIREEAEKKDKLLKNTLESARENLVDEFVSVSKKIKRELIDENDNRFDEIRETIDNKISDLADTLTESLKTDFKKSSKLFDNSIKELVKESYNSLQPKIDKELKDIAINIVEKVDSIDKELDKKLENKVDRTIIENVEGELNAISKANIELNDKINKGVNKALSRVGNSDKKIDKLTIAISEEVEEKISKAEDNINLYYDERLKMLEEKTFNITEETRKYITSLITDSRNGLIDEIRDIQKDKPIEYIVEKNGKKNSISSDDISKELNNKINSKIETEITRLRKYVTMFGGGGGTVAMQFANGGTMNGDLTVVGSISASQYLGLPPGSGGGSNISGLSANWEDTYTIVQANSATWGSGGGGSGGGISSDPITNIIVGDGATSVYAISGAESLVDASHLRVSIDGAVQTAEVDYTVNDNVITFTSPVLDGASAIVVAPNITQTVSNPITTTLYGDGSTSAFTISGAEYLFNSSSLRVSIDGAVQTPEVDYTINNNIITFTSPVLSGAEAIVVSPNSTMAFTERSTLDDVLSRGNTSSSDISISGSLSSVGGIYKGYKTITENYTVQDSDYTLHTTLSSVNILLQSSVGQMGRILTFKHLGTGTINISAFASEKIDVVYDSININSPQARTIQSTGGGWIII